MYNTEELTNTLLYLTGKERELSHEITSIKHRCMQVRHLLLENIKREMGKRTCSM